MCLNNYVAHDLFFQALRLDLSSVLKDQSLLYPFIQFLKGEGCVNVLQFCLDVGKIFGYGLFYFIVVYFEDSGPVEHSQYNNSLWAGQSWDRIPLLVRPALGPTHPPVQWVPGLFSRGKAARSWH
jgi:hypothetical protein